MIRKEILETAMQYTTADRETQYGTPENNFALIAEYWSIFKQIPFTAHDVGVMMALLKIARIQSGQAKADNYIDLAGYAACAGEIAGSIKDDEHEPKRKQSVCSKCLEVAKRRGTVQWCKATKANLYGSVYQSDCPMIR